MNKIIFLSILFITGCNSQNKTENATGEIIKDSSSFAENNSAVAAGISNCYSWNIDNDSVELKLSISGIRVTGALWYHLYEKDNNKGTINGSLKDSLIIADYTFQSEGMTSVRQVVFKMKSDTLLEGYGDIVMKGDTAMFKNIAQLKFQDDRPLLKVNCK